MFDRRPAIICWGYVQSVQLLKAKLDIFLSESGLKANLSKSPVYCGGIGHQVKESILELLGYEDGGPPFKYQGVPLSTNSRTITQCQPLVDKITVRIIAWMEDLLVMEVVYIFTGLSSMGYKHTSHKYSCYHKWLQMSHGKVWCVIMQHVLNKLSSYGCLF